MPDVETWLAELDAERRKFTRADEWKMRLLVRKLIDCGEYPEFWNGEPLEVWPRVQGWGAYWHRFSEPLECPECKADLRDMAAGPPFGRLIGLSDGDSVHTWRCPDCQTEWPRGTWLR